MNSLQNYYCEECDNDLEIKYKNLKKKINIENENSKEIGEGCLMCSG